MRKRILAGLFASFLILAASGVAWSQSVQGVITGTITDPTGAVVPGANITATNLDTSVQRTATTNGEVSTALTCFRVDRTR